MVGLHSGLATVAPKTDAKTIKARVLVCIGGDDPFIPLEQRAGFEAEMRDAGVDWQLIVYGNTVHSFTNPTAANAKRPNAVRYSAEADKRSWKSMQDLFVEAFARVPIKTLPLKSRLTDACDPLMRWPAK